MRKPKFLKNGHLAEESIQCLVMDYVRGQSHIAPYVFHIPNEGHKTVYYKALQADMGVKPGVSDLMLCKPCRGFHGGFIELKSAKGKVSAVQKDFLALMSRENYFTAICYSIEEAIERISWYFSA